MALDLTDTHAHLDYLPPEQLPEVLGRARDAGVSKIITIGTGVDSSRRAVEIATGQPGVFAAVGVHPHEAAGATEDDWRALAELAASERVIAVGETGLDYFYEHSSKESQRAAFERHLDLADAHGLPIVIHCRDAYADLMEILERRCPESAVLHCFSGGPEEAEAFLNLGCYISFSGIVTFANAEPVRRAAAIVPWDRLLVETDCPYLTPHPHRGRQNEPAYVALVAEKVAEVKEATIEKTVKATTANADRLFCI